MTLQLYILRQLVVSAVFAVAAIAFVIFPAVTVNAAHKLGGVGVSALAGFLPLIAVEMVPYMVPLAFLLAVVATFGRLAADNEWTAILMAGINPARLLVPAVLFASVLCMGTHWLLATVSPTWKFTQTVYRREAIARAFRNLYPGRTEIRIGDFYLQSARRKDNTFFDVLVYLPADEGEKRNPRLVAEVVDLSIRGDDLVVYLKGSQAVAGNAELSGDLTKSFSFDDLIATPDRKRSRPKYLTSDELRAAVEKGGMDEETLRDFRYESSRRLALSTTYLLFLALGVPTGLWLRKGTQLAAMAAAVAYALIYYVLFFRLGKQLNGYGIVPPEVAAWTTNAVGTIAGVVFLVRMLRR